MDAVRTEISEFVPGVWLASEPVDVLGMKLTATMAILRLSEGKLLVFSPVKLTTSRRAAIDELGEVTHLYAPNTFHHMWLGEWTKAFPQAVVHGPQALKAKRPELRIDRCHDLDPLGPLAAELEEVHIDGFTLEETALVHRASSTAFVADLVHNIGRPTHRWTALYTRAMGFYGRVAISKMIRWTSFRNKRAARVSLDRLLECSFDRMVVGHGDPIRAGAKEALAGAYSWLSRNSRAVVVRPARPAHGRCG